MNNFESHIDKKLKLGNEDLKSESYLQEKSDEQTPDSELQFENIPEYPITPNEYEICWEAFLKAVRHKNQKLIDSLITKNDIINKKFGDHNETLLHVVAREGAVDTAIKLVQLGSNINARSKMGLTPIFYAIEHSPEMLKVFLSNGADLNTQNHYSDCPIFHAISVAPDVIELLIKGGSDVNNRNVLGETPIFHAIKKSPEIVQLLIKNNANVNARNETGESPIFYAVRHSTAMVELLLKNGADLNVRNNFSETPIFIAILKTHEMINILLKHGADINDRNSELQTPLYKAIRTVPKMVEFLLESGADVNARNNILETPIFHAIKHTPDLVELLIKHGADVNAKNKMRETPLFYAVEHSQELVNLLLENKADVNVRNEMGEYPIFRAIRHSPEMVELLIKNGAEVNVQNNLSESPIFHAVNHSIKMVQVFLQSGADINTQNNALVTPIFHAIQHSQEMVKLLVDNGAKMNVLNRNGKSVLHEAILRKVPAVVKFLLDQGADVNFRCQETLGSTVDLRRNIPSNDGSTPLHEACRDGNMELLKMLLEFRADISITDKNKNSVLHSAVLGNSIEIVQFLLQKGLGIDIKNARDETPLLCIVKKSGQLTPDNLKMMEYLVDHGADVNTRTSAGLTALHVALFSQKFDAFEFLLQSGADFKLNNLTSRPQLGSVYSSSSCSVFGLQVFISFIAITEKELGNYINWYIRDDFFNKHSGLNKITNIFENCKLELEKLKCRTIVENRMFTFSEFLTWDFYSAVQMVKVDEIREVFQEGGYTKCFPCYAFLIEKRFERVKALEKYVNNSEVFLRRVFSHLPILVIRKILSFLSSKEYRILGKQLSGEFY